MPGQTLMIQGTASDVGKSVIVQALCRYFADEGRKVFPFKSQNMSYSYITAEGAEMSLSQAEQAVAARREPDVRMNPILLKPVHDKGSEVILMGESQGYMSAQTYHAYKPQLTAQLQTLVHELKRENDLLLIEGAGSPAEINLNKDDLVNMGLARIADSPVVLVADIDRGGVFASIYGTLELLPKEDRQRVKGIIINKFRGDRRLLESGLRQIEDLTSIPVLGVIPVFDLPLTDEDSLGTEKLSHYIDPKKDLDIAIIEFRGLKNFPDYQALFQQTDVHVRLVAQGNELGAPDLIILPDHQSAKDNSLWLKDTGLEAALKATNAPIIAFNKGALHLGNTWKAAEEAGEGLELVPHDLVLESISPRRHTQGYQTDELNIENLEGPIAFTATLGLFADEVWTRNYLNNLRQQKGLGPITPAHIDSTEDVYNQLAAHVVSHLDLDTLNQIVSDSTKN
jgi:adenosylcobyric acid synthase